MSNIRGEQFISSCELFNAHAETERLQLGILRIRNIKWPGRGECVHMWYIFCTTGCFWYNVVRLSERIILMKIKSRATRINLIQIYDPAADKDDDKNENV